ncbi:MAG: hypothetical protein WC718_13610 [Phycisphaerales bacterium]|jgi:hypothetical protein
MKYNILAFVVAAGVACPAIAQNEDLPWQPNGGEVVISPSRVEYANPPLRNGYQPRASVPVYDNFSLLYNNGTGGTYLGQCNQILEDISFAEGPWGLPYEGPRVISEVTWTPVALGEVGGDRVFLVLWDASDVSYAGFQGPGTSMIRTGATPLGAFIVDPSNVPPGPITIPNLGVVVPRAALGVFVQVGWLKASAGVPADFSNLDGLLAEDCPAANQRGLAFGSNSLRPPGGNPATVGTTLPDFGRDILSGTVCILPLGCPDAGRFLGASSASTGGCVERRAMQITPPGGFATQGGLQLRIAGEVGDTPCDPDLNHDGNVDQGDVDYLLNVVAGAPNPTGIDPDFNHDGNVDQGDVDSLLNVVAGGACP